MARKRDRVFALSVAALFFVSAFGFSFYVIYQAVTSNSSSDTASTSSATCTSSTPAAAALAQPTSYIPSGPITSLQATDLTVGTGKAAVKGDCLIVKYDGSLASNGTVFDQDFTADTAFEFQLGAGQVIPGWDQGLIGMKVGGTRRLVIPSSLAYGNQSPGASIPANSNLVFVVYLISIE